MEILIGVVVLFSTLSLTAATALWIEVRAFRELNEGLGTMIMEIETAQNQMRAGVLAAIHERVVADQAPEDKARAH